jgi:single-stranded-DNA-specific exonuclease
MARNIEKRWRITPCDTSEAEALARGVGITPVAARALWLRGVRTPDEVRAFLKPALANLHDPLLMPGMAEAAERIHRAVQQGEAICVYGDYDVDGITATSILLRCLSIVGVEGFYYIPRRLEEGYGLSTEAISALAEGGARLLITVDCGIRAIEEVALARELGMDVIITDHHEPGEDVPAEVCIINPKLPDSPYPFRELSGAGIAFKLAWAIGKSFSNGTRVSGPFKDFLLDSMTLAALGTIADVVPLRDENRVIARFGLMGLGNSTAAGIRALCDASGITGQSLTSFDVGFKLAPRLNAAGRMGCARRCVELMTTDSPDQAAAIAHELGKENVRRQKIQEHVLTEARAMLEERGDADDCPAIVLACEGWHAGVVGIVASRLASEFWCPVILLTITDGIAHGSARSVAPLNLLESIEECSHHLIGFGGHAMAAGMRMDADMFEEFRKEFEGVVAKRLEGVDLRPFLDAEGEVVLSDIDRQLVGELESLGPFGSENPEPLFMAFGVDVRSDVKRMGNAGKHLSFWASQNGAAFRAIAFNMGDLADELAECESCSIAFVPKVNRWKGRESLELDVRDIKMGSPDRHREEANE